MSTATTTSTRTDKSSSRLLPWVTWTCGAGFYFYEWLLNVSPSVMRPELMRAFAVSANKLGIFAGIFFWAYAILQIPGGVLLDRLGPRRLLTSASCVCAVGSLLFGFSDLFAVAMVGRLLMGVGASFAAIGCMKLAADWFPLNRFALLTGMMVTIGMMGGIIGEAPLAVFVESFHWRNCMVYLGLIGIFIALCCWLIIRDRDHEHDADTTEPTLKPQFKQVLKGLKQVVHSKQSWLVALYGCVMFAPTQTFLALWGVDFLIAKLNITRPEAAGVASLILIGWAIGSPIFGWFSDWLGRRLPPMMLSSLGAMICMSSVIYAPNLTVTQVRVLLFTFGIFSSGFLPSFSIIREISPTQSKASALGFMNMMNTLGTALALPLSGYLLDFFWAGAMDGDIPHYSLVEYQKALTILPVYIGIALCVLPFLKETYCRVVEYED